MTTTQLTLMLREFDELREPDWTLLGICADAMQECEDPDWRGFWWALERRRWPFRGEKNWDWFRKICGRAALGEVITKYWRGYGMYPTLTAAFRDVANMLRLAEADGVDTNKL